MRHCSTDGYWPNVPGYRTPAARRLDPTLLYEALRQHLQRLPEWIVWDGEFVTRLRPKGRLNSIVTVTRCSSRGHLTTVQHLSSEPYPSP